MQRSGNNPNQRRYPMDCFRLRGFFLELIDLAIKHPGTIGFPCSKLLKDMVMRNEAFISRIKGDYTGDSTEYRLNEAGLKMHWRVDSQRRFSCTISGDQAKDYPFFVAEARQLIKKYGYERR
jgi:hypothetical protein